MKTVLLSLASVFLLALGQVLWKIGTNQVGVELSLNNFFPALFKLLTNFWFLLGSVISLASSILWIVALSTAPLNEVFPYFALSYVFVFILSWLLLHEEINTLKLTGMLIICLGVGTGVVLIALSGKH
ncbi:MAG: EamA family transporter [Candidatus Firestonebacteria bacterium]